MIKYKYNEKRKYKYKYYGGEAESSYHHFLRRNHQLETTQLQSFKGGSSLTNSSLQLLSSPVPSS